MRGTSKGSTQAGSNIAMQDFASLLWNTSTKVFLDNQDRFLRSFTSKTFSSSKIIQEIQNVLVAGVPIGEPSAMGSNKLVTTKEGNKYVVKTMVICPDNIGGADVFKQTLCEQTKLGDVIFRVPSSYERKQLLLTPNYFSESLIGILLSSKKIKNHTPSFPVIYGFQYDDADPHKNIYTVMEPLQPVMPLLDHPVTMIYFFFQVAAALNVAQKLGRYTHYDLHSGNVLSRSKDPDTIRVYELNNGKYLYALFEFDTVIIDFGMNRMETTQEVIIPKVNFPAPVRCEDIQFDQLQQYAKQNNILGYENMSKEELCNAFGIRSGNTQLPDAFNFYEFNPYYDLFTILYFTMYKDEKVPIAGTDPLLSLREKLMSSFLGVESDDTIIRQHIDNFLLNYWRPNPNAFGELSKGGISPMTPENFMSSIADIIENSTNVDVGNLNSPSFDLEGITGTLISRRVIVLNKLVSLDGIGGLKQSVVYPQVPKKDAMSTIYYPIRTIDKHSFPYIRIDTVHQVINNNSQYIHVATIDQIGGIENGGYNFRFDCCRVDIRNFFRSEFIESGVAINAGFFRIKTDFLPIGYYKTPDMLSDNPVPNLYKSTYGTVIIRNNGKIGVSLDGTNSDAEQVLTVGPVLLWDDQIVMTKSKMAEIDNGIAKFACVKAPGGMNANSRYFPDLSGVNVPNCDTISPGELSHSSNPNPRSAIAINAKNGYVHFVYVEGREQRGVGVDMEELAEICKNLGATYAINLDGGGSSQLVWRAPGENIINQTNPTHDFGYPVGNIISFVREK